jgi:MFS family permease
VRKLLVLAVAMACFETLFYSAVVPLLPSYRTELALSKAQLGLLVAAYAIGLSVAAVPVGWLSARVGVKESALAGLAVLAVTSSSFGFASDYRVLLGARLIQGVAGAACWASGLAWLVDPAPRDRRARLIGVFVSAGAAGQILGPAVGALAQTAGRRGVFLGLGVVALALVAVGTRQPGPPGRDSFSLSSIGRAHASRAIVGRQLMVLLPGLLLGTIGVLAPLRLNELGVGSTGIAATFLVAAALGVLLRPGVGGWADRRGTTVVTRLLLAAATLLSIVVPWLDNRWALEAVVVVAIATYGLLWAPVMARLSRVYEDHGVGRAQGFAFMNLSAGAGIVAGSAGLSEVAHLAGDAASYGLVAAACLLAFAADRAPLRQAPASLTSP